MTLINTTACGPSYHRPSLIGKIGQFVGVWRQRQILKSLDAAALEDIGISKADALTEANRPIWDAPTTWRA